MFDNLIKKGHLVVPLFIFLSLVSRLRSESKCSVLPLVVSVVSSFDGENILDKKLIERLPYLKSFSRVGRGESVIILFSSHALMSILMNKPLKFEKKAFLAFVITGLTAVSLKQLFHRTRPNTGKDIFHGPAFTHKHVSFPSGHTQMAFTMAGIMSERYGHPGIFYALSSLVGAARIAKGMHYLSDVVMGAFTGYFISKLAFGKMPCPRIYVHASRKEVRFLYVLK